MSRDAGFPTADIDVHYLDDPKVRRLIRGCADPDLAARAILVHLSAVLASWAHGEATSVDDAAPLWIPDVADIRARLADVELVDADGRIASRGWESWFGPAKARREERREAGARGGRARARKTAVASSAIAEPQAPASGALPVRPSVPSVPSDRTVPSGRPRATSTLERVGSIVPRLELVGSDSDRSPA